MEDKLFNESREHKERLKELHCFYELSKIANDPNLLFEEILQFSADRIPGAWFFSEDAICEIKIYKNTFVSGKIPAENIFQNKKLTLNNQIVGEVNIYYPADIRNSNDFLVEEELLLEKIASDIALILERHEIKKREIQYVKNIQKQDRLNILSEITAGIAHELNTPLGTIFGFSQLIISSDENEQTVADAKKIFDAAKHASEIVKKLMLFSCDLPQNYELTSLNSLTENAIQLLRPNFMDLDVALSFHRDPMEKTLKLDPIQITQVIFNLLLNAMQASPKGGKMDVLLNSTSEYVQLEVIDYGEGISKNNINKIFEPFYSTKKKRDGTGLGLSVVHGIIKAHKGTIEVFSEPSIKTIFTVRLPITN